MHHLNSFSTSTAIPMHCLNSSTLSQQQLQRGFSSASYTPLEQLDSFTKYENATANQQQQLNGSKWQVSQPSSRAESGSSRPPFRTSGAEQQYHPIDPEETQLNDFDAFNFTTPHDFDDDESLIAEMQLEATTPSDLNGGPPEWDGANPDAVIAHLKAVIETV